MCVCGCTSLQLNQPIRWGIPPCSRDLKSFFFFVLRHCPIPLLTARNQKDYKREIHRWRRWKKKNHQAAAWNDDGDTSAQWEPISGQFPLLSSFKKRTHPRVRHFLFTMTFSYPIYAFNAPLRFTWKCTNACKALLCEHYQFNDTPYIYPSLLQGQLNSISPNFHIDSALWLSWSKPILRRQLVRSNFIICFVLSINHYPNGNLLRSPAFFRIIRDSYPVLARPQFLYFLLCYKGGERITRYIRIGDIVTASVGKERNKKKRSLFDIPISFWEVNVPAAAGEWIFVLRRLSVTRTRIGEATISILAKPVDWRTWIWTRCIEIKNTKNRKGKNTMRSWCWVRKVRGIEPIAATSSLAFLFSSRLLGDAFLGRETNDQTAPRLSFRPKKVVIVLFFSCCQAHLVL